jgi:hypothetical protein
LAGKTRKCQWCKEQGLLEEMKMELVGKTKPVKKFYHKTCMDDYEKDKAFKAQEAVELDKLVEVLKDIYGVKEISKQAYTLIQKLRNGEKVFGSKQQTGKRYKKGYEYSLIAETFEHCSDTIAYWNGVKGFEEFTSAFKYALTIVIDKIYFVEQRSKEREKKKALIEKHMEEVKHTDDFESSYKKKEKSKADISDFLDD